MLFEKINLKIIVLFIKKFILMIVAKFDFIRKIKVNYLILDGIIHASQKGFIHPPPLVNWTQVPKRYPDNSIAFKYWWNSEFETLTNFYLSYLLWQCLNFESLNRISLRWYLDWNLSSCYLCQIGFASRARKIFYNISI